jgi:hypothetical protein
MSSLLDEEQSYYELLEVRKDSSPAEIRSAYMRARASWKKDNVAFYSIFSEEDTERLLRRIEEAYQTLSHPERRREYDRSIGIQITPSGVRSDASGLFHLGKPRTQRADDPPSNDPPMDTGTSDSDLLIPPSTDFSPAPLRPFSSAPSASSLPTTEDPSRSARNTDTGGRRSPLLDSITKGPKDPTQGSIATARIDPESTLPPPPPADQEWRGQTLRRARESQGITLEELSAYTKIGKNYINAIEEEHLDRLPAPVFLRGFLITIARRLKLPQEQVATAWMERLQSSRSY